MKDNKQSINIILPGLSTLYKLNHYMIDLQLKFPEVFNDNLHLQGVYGSFPYSIWSSDISAFNRTSSDEIQYMTAAYNDKNIQIFYSFANHLLNRNHVMDTFGNLCLEIANNNTINHAVINSPILEKHIRENYKNIGIVAFLGKLSKLPNLSPDKYKLIFIDTSFKKFLPQNDKLLLKINQDCNDTCKKSNHCIKQILYNKMNFLSIENQNCPFKKKSQFYSDSNVNTYKETLVDAASNFIISDFGLNRNELIRIYASYLIKSEFQEEIKNKLAKIEE